MPAYVSLTRKPTWEEDFRARGMSLVGGLLTNPTVFYDPMLVQANWLRSGSNVPVLDKTATAEGGAMLLDTTAGAGGTSDLYLNNQTGTSRTTMVARPSTSAWYMAWRCSIGTAVNNQTQMLGGLQDAGLSVAGYLVGVYGPTSTTKFSALSGANTALSTVDIATGTFEIEAWSVGSTALKFRVNGETPVSCTYGDGAIDAWFPKFVTANGAGGGQRTWQIMDVLAISNGS